MVEIDIAAAEQDADFFWRRRQGAEIVLEHRRHGHRGTGFNHQFRPFPHQAHSVANFFLRDQDDLLHVIAHRWPREIAETRPQAIGNRGSVRSLLPNARLLGAISVIRLTAPRR